MASHLLPLLMRAPSACSTGLCSNSGCISLMIQQGIQTSSPLPIICAFFLPAMIFLPSVRSDCMIKGGTKGREQRGKSLQEERQRLWALGAAGWGGAASAPSGAVWSSDSRTAAPGARAQEETRLHLLGAGGASLCPAPCTGWCLQSPREDGTAPVELWSFPYPHSDGMRSQEWVCPAGRWH